MHAADILMPVPLRASVIDRLEQDFSLHRLWEQTDPDAYLADIAPRIRGLAIGGHFQVDAPFLDRFPALEIVGCFGVGYDHVDARHAGSRGIVVTNTPDVLTDEVADLAVGLLLATLRQIPQADRYLRAGGWSQGAFPLTGTLRERTIGILGLGRIGGAIAHRLEAFGVSIAYHGRRPKADVKYPYYPTPEALAEAVDVLIVATPGGGETRHLVGESVLKALGADGVLINIGRGSAVDEAALVAALRKGIILAAGLDVFEHEPNVPRALIDMDSVVLLPHIGSGSVHTREAMGRLLVDNLVSWFSGRGALTPVRETPADRPGIER